MSTRNTDNPLLRMVVDGAINTLPEFAEIKPEHVIPAIKQTLKENREAITALCESKQANDAHADETEIVLYLQNLQNRLQRVWSPVKHLNAVSNSKELRKAYTACLPLISEYTTEIGQHRELYKLLKKNRKSNLLASEVQVVIDNYMKKFRLSGIGLAAEKQQRYKSLSSQLASLQSSFADNVLDATQAWNKHLTDNKDLQGLPNSAMKMLEASARQKGLDGWLVTLDFPIYHAVMTYADDRSLRKELYKRFCTRASDQIKDGKQFDNSELMQRILKLRAERARLLGFEHYAEQSLYTKMADSPEQVIDFLKGLLNKVKPQAEQEMARLKSFAKYSLSINDMQVWDQAYVAEKLKKQDFDYTEEMVKPWFSEEQVLGGLFSLLDKLYGYRVERKDHAANRWHEDVRFYEIIDSEDTTIACFYLDLYARENKRGGAWMDSLCGRLKDASQNKIQIPVAYMTCNLTPPDSEGHAARFTHDEVITLFHEFGHGLHHMLTKIEYLDISGINGVEWDAVELPSQFMENWCWEKESLDLFARHCDTDAPIPDEIYHKLLKTRHFNSALTMLRQIEFALFDMYLHQNKEIESYETIREIVNEVRKLTSTLPVPKFNRFENSFSHIFAGGYAAGYYSYLWAEVLSADAFAKFKETGLFNKETARSFLHEILEKGGSRPAKESFIQYRGREPEIAALLKQSGIH